MGKRLNCLPLIACLLPVIRLMTLALFLIGKIAWLHSIPGDLAMEALACVLSGEAEPTGSMPVNLPMKLKV